MTQNQQAEGMEIKDATEVKLSDWTFRYPKNATLVAIDEIDMSDRSREDFGNIEELALSIRKTGLIHPPTVTQDVDGSYKLIGGERRIRALLMLNIQFIPVNVREPVELHEVLEMELMENFHRLQMKWQEQSLLIARTHREKVRVNSLDSKNWGVRETGRLMNVSSAHVSHATSLLPYLLNKDPEILAASSMFSAYEVLLKRQEDQAAKRAVGELNLAAQRASTATGIHATNDDTDDIFGGQQVLGDESIGMFLNDVQTTFKLDLNLGALFKNIDCLEYMPKMDAESVDHIVTDPPYGINVAEFEGIKNIENVIDTHDAEQNISMFEPFLEQSFRILRPSGFCVFWFDFKHSNKLMDLAEKVGFRVQQWPLVWHKLHPCLNNSPRKNFTKNVEFAMVCSKKDAALTGPQQSSLFGADGQADRKLYDNPFAKPLRAWTFILNAIAYKGQTIWDPYAGQMSCARAAINLGMIPMGCEIQENHYNLGIVQLTKLIKEINGD